jgi:hypothetical protein
MLLEVRRARALVIQQLGMHDSTAIQTGVLRLGIETKATVSDQAFVYAFRALVHEGRIQIVGKDFVMLSPEKNRSKIVGKLGSRHLQEKTKKRRKYMQGHEVNP